ncbi:MAG: peptidoglycan bridge formation glycyltransferase FemA/FemB family protein [Treponema sp.]|nr:peptidoglycan bridge formation glycyltransferase FemA/FemB family protein [Treponema sp.]
MFEIEIKEINESEHCNNGSFLQTPFWCQFKARHGWTYRRFFIKAKLPAEFFENNNNEEPSNKDNHECESCTNLPVKKTASFEKSFEIALLNRSLAKNIFSIAYVPLMPELPFECTDPELIDQAFDEEGVSLIKEELVTPETQTIEFVNLMHDLAFALKPYLPKNTIAIRFDPNVLLFSPEERDDFNHGMKIVSFADALKLKKSKVDIQPPDSTLVDLTVSEDEILSRMHSKWRYNIRLSERKGVKIHCYSGKDVNLSEKIDKFYELTKETNARDGNSSHAKSYYLDLIKSSAEEIDSGKDSPKINLYIAEHEGDEIASIMTLFSHDEAIYLYGASSNNKRNLMPNHLLQWTAMKDAKAYGSRYYDMYGMPPEGKDENHPMHGLYMFKANFGGLNIHRPGSWDYPLKFSYRFYRLAENMRAFWHKKVIKKFKGR